MERSDWWRRRWAYWAWLKSGHHMRSHNNPLHLQTDTDLKDWEMSPVSVSTNRVVPGPQEPEEKTYPPSEGLFTDAHVPDFDSYLALYKKSTEEPEGIIKQCIITEKLLHSRWLIKMFNWNSSCFIKQN